MVDGGVYMILCKRNVGSAGLYHSWYAWYPVWAWSGPGKEVLVWRERVERRYIEGHYDGRWTYRITQSRREELYK